MTSIEKSSFPTTLIIKATERDRTQVALVIDNETSVLDEPLRAQELPAMIERLLKKKGCNITDIKRVVVDNEPGSLTAVRIGVTTANTLAWSRKVPVIEMPGLSIDSVARDLKTNELDERSTAKVKLPSLPNN